MFDDVLSTLLELVRELHPAVRTAIAGVAILLETSVLLGLFIPGDTIVIISATGVEGPVEWVAMIIVVVIGALCGESIGFAIGHWFGPRIRDSWLARRLGVQRIDRAQRFLRRRGGIGIFVSRFLPVLHSVVPLVAGMSEMRYRTFIAWTAPACVIWSSAYVSVSALAAASYTDLVGRLNGASFVFVGIIVAFLLIVLLVKWLLDHGVRRDDAKHAAAEHEAAKQLEAEDKAAERATIEQQTGERGTAAEQQAGEQGAIEQGAGKHGASEQRATEPDRGDA